MQEKQNLSDKFSASDYPHFIKYMGSKSKIIDFVLEGINEVYIDGPIVDLFSGSASLAGAIGQQAEVISNDIQKYSAVLANAYLTSWKDKKTPTPDQILDQAKRIVLKNKNALRLNINYLEPISRSDFIDLEKTQQNLINRHFKRDWHLFVKYYSGTWWTAEQCLWIDAIRQVADDYKNSASYNLILACLMYAMAYTSQGTGHYAQYRDANTDSSMKDIVQYRRRSIENYFHKKYNVCYSNLESQKPKYNHKAFSLDFKDCLKKIPKGTVYADPPYCFVHYSRFYHAIETLVLYDYPKLQIKNGNLVKGRYREGRHQSPFCIKTQVKGAFDDLFQGIKRSKSSLVLSYSDTGMITIEQVAELAKEILGPEYKLELLLTDHQHMTLGRQGIRHRDVKECLLLAKHS